MVERSLAARRLGVAEGLLEEIEAGAIRLDPQSVTLLGEAFPFDMVPRLHHEVARYQADRWWRTEELARSEHVNQALAALRPLRLDDQLREAAGELWEERGTPGAPRHTLTLARELYGMSLRDVAAEVGVTSELVRVLEVGRVRRSRPATVMRLCHLLKASADALGFDEPARLAVAADLAGVTAGQLAQRSGIPSVLVSEILSSSRALLHPFLFDLLATAIGGPEETWLRDTFAVDDHPEIDTRHALFYARRVARLRVRTLSARTGIDGDLIEAIERGEVVPSREVATGLVACLPEAMRPLLLRDDARYREMQRSRNAFARGRKAVGLTLDEHATLAGVPTAVVDAFETGVAPPERKDLSELLALFPEPLAGSLREEFGISPPRVGSKPSWHATPDAFVRVPPPPLDHLAGMAVPPKTGPPVRSLHAVYLAAARSGFDEGEGLGRAAAAGVRGPLSVVHRDPASADRRYPTTLAEPAAVADVARRLDAFQAALEGRTDPDAEEVRLDPAQVRETVYRLFRESGYLHAYYRDAAVAGLEAARDGRSPLGAQLGETFGEPYGALLRVTPESELLAASLAEAGVSDPDLAAAGIDVALVERVRCGARPLDPFLMERCAQVMPGKRGDLLRRAYSLDAYPQLLTIHPWRWAREAHGIDVDTAAGRLGVRPQVMTDLESGLIPLDDASLAQLGKLLPFRAAAWMHVTYARYSDARPSSSSASAHVTAVPSTAGEWASAVGARPIRDDGGPRAGGGNEEAGRRLARALKTLDLTANEFAVLSGLPRSQVDDALDGYEGLADIAVRSITHALGVTAADLGFPEPVEITLAAELSAQFQYVVEDTLGVQHGMLGRWEFTDGQLDPFRREVAADVLDEPGATWLRGQAWAVDLDGLDLRHPVYYALKAGGHELKSAAAQLGMTEATLRKWTSRGRSPDRGLVAAAAALLPDRLAGLLLNESARYAARAHTQFIAARREAGLTAAEVALLAGCEPSVVEALEGGGAFEDMNVLEALIQVFPEPAARRVREAYGLPEPSGAAAPRAHWQATADAFVRMPPPPSADATCAVPALDREFLRLGADGLYALASTRGFGAGVALGREAAARWQGSLEVIARQASPEGRMHPTVLARPAALVDVDARLGELRAALDGRDDPGAGGGGFRLTELWETAYRLFHDSGFLHGFYDAAAARALGLTQPGAATESALTKAPGRQEQPESEVTRRRAVRKVPVVDVPAGQTLVAAYCKAAGLSVRELARRTRRGHTRVERIHAGDSLLDPFTARQFADALGEELGPRFLDAYVPDYRRLDRHHPIAYFRYAYGISKERLHAAMGGAAKIARQGYIVPDADFLDRVIADLELPDADGELLRTECRLYDARRQAVAGAESDSGMPGPLPDVERGTPSPRPEGVHLLDWVASETGMTVRYLIWRSGFSRKFVDRVRAGAVPFDPFLRERFAAALDGEAGRLLREAPPEDDFAQLDLHHPLAYARQWSGRTQPQLARALGVSRHDVVRWELGREPIGADILDRICRELGEPFGSMLREEDRRYWERHPELAGLGGPGQKSLGAALHVDGRGLDVVAATVRAPKETLRRIIRGEVPLDPFRMEKFAQLLRGGAGQLLRDTYRLDDYPELMRQHPHHWARRAFGITPSKAAAAYGVDLDVVRDIELGLIPLDDDSLAQMETLFPPRAAVWLRPMYARYMAARAASEQGGPPWLPATAGRWAARPGAPRRDDGHVREDVPGPRAPVPGPRPPRPPEQQAPAPAALVGFVHETPAAASGTQGPPAVAHSGGSEPRAARHAEKRLTSRWDVFTAHLDVVQRLQLLAAVREHFALEAADRAGTSDEARERADSRAKTAHGVIDRVVQVEALRVARDQADALGRERRRDAWQTVLADVMGKNRRLFHAAIDAIQDYYEDVEAGAAAPVPEVSDLTRQRLAGFTHAVQEHERLGYSPGDPDVAAAARNLYSLRRRIEQRQLLTGIQLEAVEVTYNERALRVPAQAAPVLQGAQLRCSAVRLATDERLTPLRDAAGEAERDLLALWESRSVAGAPLARTSSPRVGREVTENAYREFTQTIDAKLPDALWGHPAGSQDAEFACIEHMGIALQELGLATALMRAEGPNGSATAAEREWAAELLRADVHARIARVVAHGAAPQALERLRVPADDTGTTPREMTWLTGRVVRSAVDMVDEVTPGKGERAAAGRLSEAMGESRFRFADVRDVMVAVEKLRLDTGNLLADEALSSVDYLRNTRSRVQVSRRNPVLMVMHRVLGRCGIDYEAAADELLGLVHELAEAGMPRETGGAGSQPRARHRGPARGGGAGAVSYAMDVSLAL